MPALASLRAEDALATARPWRLRVLGRADGAAKGRIALMAAWPGRSERVELATATFSGAEWQPILLGATPEDLAAAFAPLGVPCDARGARAIPWVELAAVGGGAWIDALTLELD